MLGTYVYFDEVKSRLHLFRRDETYLPAGTIVALSKGKATIDLWAPLVLSSLGASSSESVEIKASVVALSRKTGVKIKGT